MLEQTGFSFSMQQKVYVSPIMKSRGNVLFFFMVSKRVSMPRRMLSKALTLVILLLSPALLSVTLVSSSPTRTILTEWVVPTPESGVWGLTLDPSGKCCWFLEYSGNKVGHLDPSTGIFQEWAIPTARANPYSIVTTTIAGSLAVWGTEFRSDTVFLFSPDSGLFHEFSLGLYLHSGVAYISAEPPGAQIRVWFTEATRNRNGEFIYDPNTGNVTLYEDAFPIAAGGGAYGVYATSSSVWFAGFSALVKWERASQQYTIWPLPAHGSASVGRLITVDQYGQPWYTQGMTNGTSNDNFAGVLRGNNTLQEWRIPSPGSDPRGISINPLTQQPWIAERSPMAGIGTIATLDAFGGGLLVSSVPTTAPSGGPPTILAPILSQVDASTHTVTPTTNPILGSQRGHFTEYELGPTLPHDAIVDSSGNIWISEPGTNKIARLSLTGSDYALLASPPVISLSKGSSGIATISGASISGYAGQVTLGITTVPRGVVVSSFNPNSLNIPSGGTVSSKFAVSIAPNASAGTNWIIIQGTDGNIAHVISLMLMITNVTTPTSSGPRCLIATATYGSELSPEIQLLRDFRDNSIEKTKAGSSFLIVFNAWYYSFSPYVANYLADHEIVRTGMKFLLYPLIAFLWLASRLYAELSAYPESAILLSGLLASSLIGAFYIGLPFGLLNRRLRLARNLSLKLPSVLLLAGIGALLIGESLSSTVLLMISSSITVLATILTSSTLTAAILSLSRKHGLLF